MSISFATRLRAFLLLTIWVVGSLATVDIDVPYGQLNYLPSKDAWTNYAKDVNCPRMSSNASDAAVQYTFTGSAITFYLPKAPNGANLSITFSDGNGTIWYHDTSGEECPAAIKIKFPQYQFKPLMVTLRPSKGLYLNVQKFIITSLTIDEQNSISSLSSVSTARAATSSTTTTSQVTTTQPLPSSQIGTSDQAQNKPSNTAVMVGSILGGILGATFIAILVLFLLRRRIQRRGQKVDLGIEFDPVNQTSDSELIAAVPSPWVAPVAPHFEFNIPPPEYSGPSSSTPVALGVLKYIEL